MIIFKANDVIFAIFNNPKCASSLISKIIYPQIMKHYKVLFMGKLGVKDSGYDNVNYNHCNLKACVDYLISKHINIQDVIFITTIRNPIDRIISSYFYELKLKNLKFWKHPNDIQEDLYEFAQWDHIKHFYPNNFRCYESYKMHEILRTENIKEEFEILVKKYNLQINTSRLDNIINKTSYNKIKLCEKTIDLIKDKYNLDIIEGNYNI